MRQLNEKADGVINSKGDYLWSSNPDSIPLFYYKKRIKLTENELKNIVYETIKNIIINIK